MAGSVSRETGRHKARQPMFHVKQARALPARDKLCTNATPARVSRETRARANTLAARGAFDEQGGSFT